MTPISRRRVKPRTHLLLAALLLIWGTARAASDTVTIALPPTAAAAGLFAGAAEGFFAKHGLQTELLTQSNEVGVVAAVQSNSAQIGSVAAGVLFGAVQNGLDPVVIGCQSLFGPGTDVLAVIARKTETITTAKDFEGKRVAVPGLNGGHHLMFMTWMRAKGADPGKVNFVEVNHPQQADVLRGRSVDAVVTAEPNIARIVQAGLGTEATTKGLDIRFVVTNIAGGSAEWLYDTLYCARGQAENLIKLHKSQLASDRTSCRSALANQVRLVLHTGAFWLMLGLRDAIPAPQPLARAEFSTVRMRLIKIGARIVETVSRVRIAFAAAHPEATLFANLARCLQPAEP